MKNSIYLCVSFYVLFIKNRSEKKFVIQNDSFVSFILYIKDTFFYLSK